MIQPLTATYRLQLRGGVDFAAAETFLPHLCDLGISHLYLSPIFTAQAGSTHGYDVTDPNEIDPALGGRAGIDALVAKAAQAGIGLILDIVPNHTAFSPENPMLRDVLRHGQASRFSAHFDIDWSDRLLLPFLDEPFDVALEAGRIHLSAAADGPVMQVADMQIPLAPGSDAATSPDAIRALHDAQAWRLTHWERERDSITHRRFFNVTGLIGMRVEDAAVFDDLHRLTFDLVDKGLVQGIRIDHIDGLADPATYLDRLKTRLGETPVWVEKILTGDEALPEWPITGTTGYEAAQAICQLLTDPAGHAKILSRWHAATGSEGGFHAAVTTAKHEVIRQDLAAELHQLIGLAIRATVEAANEQGQEAVREAVIALLIAFPRYRTYLTPTSFRAADVALMDQVADVAATGLRSDTALRLLQGFITRPQSPEAAAFQTRFQQVTGALLAKSHEDTAAFRWNAYLAANEVGADPDAPSATPAQFDRFLQSRPAMTLTLTSSHDTKRSEDARMRLAALSHLPDDFDALVRATAGLPEAQAVDPNTQWYLAQTVLAIWNPADPDLLQRVQDHMTKALREAKEITSWSHPDSAPEARVAGLARAMVNAWSQNPPAALARMIAVGERLSMIQTALKITMPGVPDIFRGAEGEHLALTDPDNRRPVDLAALHGFFGQDGFTGRKARLTRALLTLRRDNPAFFDRASAGFDCKDGEWTLTRVHDGAQLQVRFRVFEGTCHTGTIWPADIGTDGGDVQISFGRDVADVSR